MQVCFTSHIEFVYISQCTSIAIGIYALFFDHTVCNTVRISSFLSDLFPIIKVNFLRYFEYQSLRLTNYFEYEL